MSCKEIVFVLGMSRAGTSALTRVLSLCGLGLPDDLVEANFANPAGFWESAGVVAMNEEFLRRHGSSWCDPALNLQLDPNVVGPLGSEEYIESVRSCLAASLGDEPLVVKDPRIVSLSSFWFEASRRSGYDVKVLLPIRHPDEVAASLATRDGAAHELSQVLWLKANFLAERQSRQFPRAFVAYSELMADWRKQAARIERSLGLDLSRRDDAQIDAFLDPALYRHHEGVRAGRPPTLPWLDPLYDALLGASRDEPLGIENVDAAFAEFVLYSQVFCGAMTEAVRLNNELGIYGGIQTSGENEERIRALELQARSFEQQVEVLMGERARVMENYQLQASEGLKVAGLVEQRMRQWSRAALVPLTGPVVLQRETRGFEPDGWMLKTAAFTCRTLQPVSEIIIDGWIPGSGGSTELEARLGDKTVRAPVVVGQSFSVKMDVEIAASEAIVLELTVDRGYLPIRELQGSQDDRELGCILQLVTFA